MGTVGDVNPLLSVAAELAGKGHEIVVLSNHQHRARVEREGFRFYPIGSGLVLPVAPGVAEEVVVLEMAAATRQTFDLLAELYQPGNTVAVSPSYIFGPRLAQEKLGLPLLHIYLDPMHFEVDKGWLRGWRERLRVRRLGGLMMREVSALHSQLGLKPMKPGWERSPLGGLALFPRWFLPDSYRYPKPLKFCDFPLYAAMEQPADPELDDFLTAGAPVVFTLGSFGCKIPQFADYAIAACTKLQKRGLLIGLEPPSIAVPENILVRALAPFDEVFQRALVVVHHCGTGTFAESLLAGVPVLAIDIGTRLSLHLVAELGVGRQLRGQVGTEALAAELQVLLNSDTIRERCRLVSRRMVRGRGQRLAAAYLESFIGSDFDTPQNRLLGTKT